MARIFTARRVVLVTVATLVLAGVLVGGASALPGGRVLVVENANTGEQLLTVPVHDGSTVDLEYHHSVEKTRVLDAYEVQGDRLVMTRTEFEDYGWGLPSRADVEIVDGVFVAYPDWNDTELYVKPGRIAGHTLSIDGTQYDLVELSNAQTVRITVAHRSALTAALASLS